MTDLLFVWFIIGAVLPGIIAATIVQRKGGDKDDATKAFLLGFFFSYLGIIILVLFMDGDWQRLQNKGNDIAISKGRMKTCP